MSGISPGTEMLFYREEPPVDGPVDMSLTMNGEALAYPLHYGYAVAGHVAEVGTGVDPSWLHRRVFVFHPHASTFLADPEQLLPIPDGVSDRDAILFANMETAVNLVQDGAPRIGERVLVLGLGVVGLLVAATLARMADVHVVAVDPIAKRRAAAQTMGVATTLHPCDGTLEDFDLVYELTGRPETLPAAISATGYAGRVIVGSWYGNKVAQIPFTTHFHRNRIHIISSQVSTIAPELSARWTKQRRYALAWQLLEALPLDAMHTHVFPVEQAAEAFATVDKQAEAAIQVAISYAQNWSGDNQ